MAKIPADSLTRLTGVIQIRMRAVLIACALLSSPGVAFASKPHYILTGKVVAIADGGTLAVLDDSNTQHKIRLAGIDAPEKGRAFGSKAREQLAGKVFGEVVRVDVIDVDRYRREVGRIYLSDRFVNLEMVGNGFAWRYPQYDKAGEFTAAENDARDHQRGLWVDPHAMPPREFRAAKRKKGQGGEARP
jgi:micrococcal nuclease